MDKFVKAREKYKPSNIKFILIAESPPKIDSERFFYFENVCEKDSLFLETMKVLYLGEGKYVASEARTNKRFLLKKFQEDGFYLEDSVSYPLVCKQNQKVNKIKNNLSDLKERLKLYKLSKTKIILIAATVYEACYDNLKQNGFNVINTKSIAFPGSGGQKKFKKYFSELLRKHGFETKLNPNEVILK